MAYSFGYFIYTQQTNAICICVRGYGLNVNIGFVITAVYISAFVHNLSALVIMYSSCQHNFNN